MTTINSSLEMSGQLTMRKISRADLQKAARKRVFWWHLRNWVSYRWREIPFYIFLWSLPVLRWFIPAIAVLHSEVRLLVRRGDGTIEDYGVVGRHLVTTAGKNFVASAFDNTVEPEILKYHGYGTGTTAAAAGDTALQTEETTQYAVDNTRPTGSQAHATNTYTTVATYSPDSGGTRAITEWGLLSQASNAGGTLFDHQVFSAVNLVAASDSLQSSYVLTLS